MEAGLSVIALADHDTVAGIVPALEAAGTTASLTVIPAVEINTDVPKGEAHILGYFIDYTHQGLLDMLGRMRDARYRRAQRMAAKLRQLGLSISWERIQEIAGDSPIGRPHIAQALLEKGYINSIREAFNKYIGWGGPGYVEREKTTPVEAVKSIIQASGLPVLAHPYTIDDPEAMVVELKANGLVGIEAYYGTYTPDEVRDLVSMAKKYDLITTGGSDFHGLDPAAETPIGGTNVPMEAAEQLIGLAKERKLKTLQFITKESL
jgi:predicted metal-dependent phosphoesterase TrpH